VRIYDVAGRAGVSLATVSAVTTGNRPVAAATRAKVLRAIDELGYHANASAQALVRGRTHTLCLLIPPLRSWQAVMEMFVTLIVDAASRCGYDVLVSIAEPEDDGCRRVVGEQRVDGVLLLEVFLDDRRVERLSALGFPFVAIGRTADVSTYDCVDLDFHHVIGSLVDHLADLGHRSLALFNSPRQLYERGHGPARRSEEGFVAACERRGVRGIPLCCERNAQSGLRETQRLLAREQVTGFVVANEFTLGGIYKGVASLGRRIPEDVSVVVLGDLRVVPDLNPTPTVARHAIADMSRSAVRLMVERLESRELPPRCELIRRPIEPGASTAPAPRRSASGSRSPTRADVPEGDDRAAAAPAPCGPPAATRHPVRPSGGPAGERAASQNVLHWVSSHAVPG
jgi:DNA-binding LacI/PurR family transcriptional regulator